MSLMVTGAGLIGAQVAAADQRRGGTPVLFDLAPHHEALADVLDLDRATVVRGDVLRPDDLQHAIEANGVDRIVHTAAHPGFTGGAAEKPVATVHLNVMGTANVLEAARGGGVERVVVSSSAAVYVSASQPQPHDGPMAEEAHPRPISIYATTKLAGEALGLSYHHELGLDVRAVRFNGVFGPWAGGNTGISDLSMKRWLGDAMAGRTVVVDHPALEWLYSKDAGRGALLALDVDDPPTRVFNIGMGMPLTSTTIAAAIRDVVPGADVRAAPRATDADKPAMDPTRSAAVLGYRPDYLLPAALLELRTWLEARAGQEGAGALPSPGERGHARWGAP